MRRHDSQFKLILTYWKLEFLLQNNSFSNRCWFSPRWAKTEYRILRAPTCPNPVSCRWLHRWMEALTCAGSVGSWTRLSVTSKALPLGCLRPSKDAPPSGKAHTATPNSLDRYTSLPWGLFHTFAPLRTSFSCQKSCFISPTKWRLLEGRSCVPFTFWGSPKHAVWDGEEPCACSHL